MTQLYGIKSQDEKSITPFHSKASTEPGLWRSVVKEFGPYLKKDTLYYMYRSEFLGYDKFLCAFWNGKAFVKVLMK